MFTQSIIQTERQTPQILPRGRKHIEQAFGPSHAIGKRTFGRLQSFTAQRPLSPRKFSQLKNTNTWDGFSETTPRSASLAARAGKKRFSKSPEEVVVRPIRSVSVGYTNRGNVWSS